METSRKIQRSLDLLKNDHVALGICKYHRPNVVEPFNKFTNRLNTQRISKLFAICYNTPY